jgi:hypothetical protein
VCIYIACIGEREILEGVCIYTFITLHNCIYISVQLASEKKGSGLVVLFVCVCIYSILRVWKTKGDVPSSVHA